jgi:hypothetical protein
LISLRGGLIGARCRWTGAIELQEETGLRAAIDTDPSSTEGFVRYVAAVLGTLRKLGLDLHDSSSAVIASIRAPCGGSGLARSFL